MENKAKTKFVPGQRVITPDGEGEIIHVLGNEIKIKLNSGTIKSYSGDKLSDDSSAG